MVVCGFGTLPLWMLWNEIIVKLVPDIGVKYLNTFTLNCWFMVFCESIHLFNIKSYFVYYEISLTLYNANERNYIAF